MLFSRSEGCEVESTHYTLFKGFGKLYTGDPDVMWMCRDASRSQSGPYMFKEYLCR